MRRSHIIPIVTLACLMTAGWMARGQETNDDSGLDFKSFQVISKRNVFDPSRSGTPVRRPSTPVKRVDSFTLVGTLSSEKGKYAFFDGSGPEYRKTLRPSETIAGYKIIEIAVDYVRLAAAANQTINLPVGTRMRREEGGRWAFTGRVEPEVEAAPVSVADSSSNGVPPEAPPSAAENDVLKRLMLKRLKEK